MNELEESPRGEGPRRALGELLVCPPCTGQWVVGGLVAGLVAAPRATRLLASTFTAIALADFLHLAFVAAREKASGDG
jgi:hypothetical protein